MSETEQPAGGTRTVRSRTLALAALGVAAAAIVTVGLWWMAQEPTLPEGVRIDGVAVGGMTAEEAQDALADRAAERLGAQVTVSAGQARSVVSARLLDGSAEVGEAVDEAFAATDDGLLPRSWASGEGEEPTEFDLRVAVDHQRVERAVEGLAARAHRPPASAQLSAGYDGDGALVTDVRPHRNGREVADREALADEAAAALTSSGEETVDADMRTIPAQQQAEDAHAAQDTLHRIDERVLDQPVEVDVTDHDAGSQLTRREAGGQLAAVEDLATAAVRDAADTAATAPHPSEDTPREQLDQQVTDRVDIAVREEVLTGRAEELAASFSHNPTNAQLSYQGGSLQITGGSTGLGVSAEAVRDSLEEAVADTEETTARVQGETLQPARSRDFYDRVLLLDQSDREVALYIDGHRSDSWPVAVGQEDAPTPTGEFRIGNKRASPTWVNPDPDGWGEDMPERTGPDDSDNPLGVRALDWHRIGGGDTLIRFHGTNSPGSIGDAASRGCVRMFNDDVRDLYDRTPMGTAVLSVS